MKIFATFLARREYISLLCITLLFSLLRLPSLIEPYWYGDEGIYETIGIALRSGRELYSGIWDNKPPLLYLVYAVFNGDQFGVRLASLLSGLAAVIVFFFLTHILLTNKRIASLASGLFALLFALPLLEGNIANAENFMLFPILLASLLIFEALSEAAKKNKLQLIIHNSKLITLFLSGLLLGLAFLFKIVAIFDLAAFAVFIMFTIFLSRDTANKEETIKRTLLFLIHNSKFIILLVSGFLLPIIVSLGYFASVGALRDYIQAVFLQNVRYVGYKNAFIIPQGLLLLKLLLLLGILLYLFWQRKKYSQATLFIIIWFAFSLFNAFFSQRPYIHYALVLLPAFCLMLGLTAQEYKKNYRIPVLFIAAFVATIITFDLTTYKKTSSYYANYLSFITGNKSVSEYQRFFDSDVPRDYELARYLRSRPDRDNGVFIWGNSAQIYALSGMLPPGRYTVAYHIAYFGSQTKEEMANVLAKKKPEYIVIMPDIPDYPFSLEEYRQKIMIQDSTIYERTH
ncbi:MAG: phospholipid carrier-dependent glycosyltransferase [Candidatus Levybacteria bacterium]|nr:phospholipid carrier-dependent glycosyltransferase [Candidatus Levybacteria bacterium]